MSACRPDWEVSGECATHSYIDGRDGAYFKRCEAALEKMDKVVAAAEVVGEIHFTNDPITTADAVKIETLRAAIRDLARRAPDPRPEAAPVPGAAMMSATYGRACRGPVETRGAMIELLRRNAARDLPPGTRYEIREAAFSPGSYTALACFVDDEPRDWFEFRDHRVLDIDKGVWIVERGTTP